MRNRGEEVVEMEEKSEAEAAHVQKNSSKYESVFVFVRQNDIEK